LAETLKQCEGNQMTKRSALFLIFLLIGTAIPAMSQAQFYDDCENSPNLNGDWYLEKTSGDLSVSSEHAKSGSKSYKIAFTAGTSAQGAGKRVELVLRAEPFKHFEFGKEYWIGYSMYIPSNFRVPTSWGLSGQFHKVVEGTACDQAPRPQNPAVRQPFLNHFAGSDADPHMDLEITGQSQPCQPNGYTYKHTFSSPSLQKGKWNDIVYHIIFRYDRPGMTQMWLNGLQYVNLSEINAHNDPEAPYFKLGFYGTSSLNHVLYFDEIRVGGADSSYAKVAPPNGINPPDSGLEPPILKIVTD
jgi:hypothetical protein